MSLTSTFFRRSPSKRLWVFALALLLAPSFSFASTQNAPSAPSAASAASALSNLSASSAAATKEASPFPFALHSQSAIVTDSAGNPLYAKNSDDAHPIASLTKLMSAMVVIEGRLDLSAQQTITPEDFDSIKFSRSRVKAGSTLTRQELLALTLVASDNRAAFALARTSPWGFEGFVARMNQKAQTLGLRQTLFSDPAGLSPTNRSSAREMARILRVSFHEPLARNLSSSKAFKLDIIGKETLFQNTNSLIRQGQAPFLRASKTGHTNEAGWCLAFSLSNQELARHIVLLGAATPARRKEDALKIMRFLSMGPQTLQAFANPRAKKNR